MKNSNRCHRGRQAQKAFEIKRLGDLKLGTEIEYNSELHLVTILSDENRIAIRNSRTTELIYINCDEEVKLWKQ